MGLFSAFASIYGADRAAMTAANERAFNAQQARLNREFQTEERLATQQWNEEMWNKNNEYNSLSSQADRAIEAGFNPNVILGSGSSAGASAPSSSPQPGSQASYSSSLPSAQMQMFSQLGQQLANIRKTESETALNKQQFDWNKATWDTRVENLVNTNSQQKADLAKSWKEVTKMDFDMDMQKKTFEWLAKKSDTEIRVMEESLNKLRNESLDILKGIELKDKQGKFIDAQTQGQDIQNALNRLELQFSNAIGMPMDAPESKALFKMWQHGEFDKVTNMTAALNGVDTGTVGALTRNLSGIQAGVADAVGKAWNGVKSLFGQRKLDQNPHYKNPKYK